MAIYLDPQTGKVYSSDNPLKKTDVLQQTAQPTLPTGVSPLQPGQLASSLSLGAYGIPTKPWSTPSVSQWQSVTASQKPAAAPTPTPTVSPAAVTPTVKTAAPKTALPSAVTPSAAPAAQPQTTPFALSQVMMALQNKVTTNNSLMDTRNLILKALYDQPLTADERAKMDPAMLKAIDSGDRNMIDMNLRLISDQIQGRTNTLDQSVQYLTQAYEQTITDANNLKQQAIQNVLSFVSQYGSNASQAMTSLYGADYVNQLKGMGIDIAAMAAIPSLAEQKTEAQYGVAGGTESISIPEGTLASQNNNPGNLKYVGQAGATLGAGGFAKFDTPEAGYQALTDQISLDASRGDTIESFLNTYAPPSENDTNLYIQQMTQALGVDKSTKLSELSIDDVAKFISQKESGTNFVPVQTDVQVNGAMMASGELAPSMIGGMGTVKAKSIAEAKRIDPNYNPTTAELQFQAAKKWVGTMNSSQMVRFFGLATSVVNTINEANDKADQMKLGGITPINAAELSVLINTQGNTPQGQLASQYVAAVNTLKEEFANLAQGGFAPTEAAWSLANTQINSNYGVDQLKASLTEVQRLINFRVNAIQTQQPILPAGTTAGTTADNDPMGIR